MCNKERKVDTHHFLIFSRGHTSPHLAVAVARSVGQTVTLLNSEQFRITAAAQPHATGVAVYPALFNSNSLIFM